MLRRSLQLSRPGRARRRILQTPLAVVACSCRSPFHQRCPVPLPLPEPVSWTPAAAPRSFSSGASAFEACGTGRVDSSSGDTIYALSTAPGRAGIAVIRISGPSCLEIYKALCPGKALPKPRHATVRGLVEPQSAGSAPVLLDSEALVLYFPQPRTVTGEDVLELHVHGGPAVVKAVLAAIPRSPAHSHGSRIRYAEPGEFTRRAFFNDRLDLAQVESLSDTLAAETEHQRRAAVQGTSGALGRTYETWRQQLLLARGEIEALIDFSEDQHFDESQSELLTSVTEQITAMLHSIHLHEQGAQRSELLRNGIRIALLGPPNVGKSSLMNLVIGREASIVSGEAGTTRDIVEASLDIRGYLCSFADTAGFRSRSLANQKGKSVTGVGRDVDVIGAVEKEGIRRARRKAEEAHVIVVLASVEEGPEGPFILYDEETLTLASEAQSCLVVVNKRDSAAAAAAASTTTTNGNDLAALDSLVGEFRGVMQGISPKLGSAELLTISCKQAQQQAQQQQRSSSESPHSRDKDPGGIHEVINALAGKFSSMTEMQGDQQQQQQQQELLGVTARQGQLLSKCRRHLEEFMLEAQVSEEEKEAGMEADSVVAAEYLRYAADSLARITGKGEAGDVEDVLGVVFEKFCVGK